MRSSTLGLVGTLAAVVTLTTGCPGNTGTAGNGVSSGSGDVSTATPFGGTVGGTLPTGSTVNAINVDRVVRSNVDPNSLIEFISSDNSIGNSCNTVNDCTCYFSWIDSSGNNRQAQQVPAYLETNLLRCLFTEVDATAKYFDTYIQINTSSQVSNTVRVFMPVVNPSLDPSIASNYLPVQRYMCRDLITLKQNTLYYLNNTILDPQLWDLSLSFNLFTTSFGKDYGAKAFTNPGGGAAQNIPAWECPIVPNDPSDSNWGGAPFYNYNLYSLEPINLNNIGQTPVATGDNTIYPSSDNQNSAPQNCPTGTEPTCEQFLLNRHDFYLATFGNGVFNMPVCIPHTVANISVSPSLNCQFDSSKGPVQLGSAAVDKLGSDIIGWAAVPDSAEQCPSSNAVVIPAGKKWAKVWQFRTSFDPRTVTDIANPNDIGDLFCTTREKECMSNGFDKNGSPNANTVCWDAINPNTGGQNALGPQETWFGFIGGATTGAYGNCDDQSGLFGDGTPGATYEVDSVANPAGNACRDPNSGGIDCCLDTGGSPTNNISAGPSTNRPANYTDGGQFCNPALHGSHNAEADHGLAQDVWLLGNGGRRACIEADTDQNGKLDLQFGTAAFPPPKRSNPFITTVKPLDADSKFDYVYVVTPASVKFSDMQDVQHSDIAKQYTPWRVKPLTASDQQVYTLESGSNNAPGGIQRLSTFPLCILQDAKQGAVRTVSGAP